MIQGTMIAMLLFMPGAMLGQDFNRMVDSLLTGTVEVIYPQELSQLMEREKRPILLDAREKDEFSVSHIPGSRWVGYSEFNAGKMDVGKDAEIVVYCSVGYRSERVGEQLKDQGYRNIRNLHGGIFGWKNSGYDVVDSSGNQTNKVHAYDKSWSKWLQKGEKILDE